MAFSFLAREAGRVHVCGHRGYSLHYPENTLPALEAAKAAGATTVEIDVVLTADGEPIVLHDLTVDRTTNGHGFAADLSLEQVRRLDAGIRFHPAFAGTRIPTVAEALDWAKTDDMGIVLEIKEAERPDLAVDRVAALLEGDRYARPGHCDQLRPCDAEGRGRAPSGPADRSHHPCPPRRHRRRAEGVRREARSRSSSTCSTPRMRKALHDAGFSNRLSMPRPDVLAEYWRGGRDPLPDIVQWIADGLIDSISGDDVPFIARLLKRAGQAG